MSEDAYRDLLTRFDGGEFEVGCWPAWKVHNRQSIYE